MQNAWTGLLLLCALVFFFALFGSPIQIFVLDVTSHDYPQATTLASTLNAIFYNVGGRGKLLYRHPNPQGGRPPRPRLELPGLLCGRPTSLANPGPDDGPRGYAGLGNELIDP